MSFAPLIEGPAKPGRPSSRISRRWQHPVVRFPESHVLIQVFLTTFHIESCTLCARRPSSSMYLAVRMTSRERNATQRRDEAADYRGARDIYFYSSAVYPHAPSEGLARHGDDHGSSWIREL